MGHAGARAALIYKSATWDRDADIAQALFDLVLGARSAERPAGGVLLHLGRRGGAVGDRPPGLADKDRAISTQDYRHGRGENWDTGRALSSPSLIGKVDQLCPDLRVCS